jgi:hypothetical protein
MEKHMPSMMGMNDRTTSIITPESVQSKPSDLEILYQAINRLGALLEQYDMLDQSFGQLEMQREILDRVPSGKVNRDTVKQLSDQLSSAESHKDAVIKAIRDITGKPVGELRQVVTDLKLALSRYSEVEIEYVKTRQAFELLAMSDGFDTEEGNGGSRKEYEVELSQLKRSREFVLGYLHHRIKESLTTSSLVTPRDSVLANLLRENSGRIS